MKWISVKDQLPDETRTVIIFVNATGWQKSGVSFGWLHEDGDWVIEEPDRFTNPSVTHWMPLPKGPEEEKVKDRNELPKE